jgi:hypothetical protein
MKLIRMFMPASFSFIVIARQRSPAEAISVVVSEIASPSLRLRTASSAQRDGLAMTGKTKQKTPHPHQGRRVFSAVPPELRFLVGTSKTFQRSNLPTSL